MSQPISVQDNLYHFNLHFEADVGAVVEGVVALYEGLCGFELADV